MDTGFEISTFFVADKAFYRAGAYPMAELLANDPSAKELKKEIDNSTNRKSDEHQNFLFRL